MRILLPPSETKHPGGDGAPLDLAALSFPDLTPARDALIDALVALSTDLPRARAAIGTPPSKDHEVTQNTLLRSNPTMPALDRYTGVLFDALGAGTMTKIQRARAEARLMITSAPFGMVGAADPIPTYRFSQGSRLPVLGTPESFWRSRLDGVLGDPDELVLDLRSGAYAAFARVPHAVPSRVLTEAADGSRSIVSHFSKHAKGVLARALSTSRAELGDRAAVLRVARTAGLRVEPWGRKGIQVIT